MYIMIKCHQVFEEFIIHQNLNKSILATDPQEQFKLNFIKDTLFASREKRLLQGHSIAVLIRLSNFGQCSYLDHSSDSEVHSLETGSTISDSGFILSNCWQVFFEPGIKPSF